MACDPQPFQASLGCCYHQCASISIRGPFTQPSPGNYVVDYVNAWSGLAALRAASLLPGVYPAYRATGFFLRRWLLVDGVLVLENEGVYPILGYGITAGVVDSSGQLGYSAQKRILTRPFAFETSARWGKIFGIPQVYYFDSSCQTFPGGEIVIAPDIDLIPNEATIKAELTVSVSESACGATMPAIASSSLCQPLP